MQSSEIFDTERITAVCENSGERIDALLTHIVPELSRSAAQRLTQEGSVLVNGRAVKKNHVCREGDSVEVFLPPAVPTEIVAQDISLDVVYEDADVIAVNKPRGMVVHPAPGHPDGTLVNALLWHCGASLSGIGGEIRPGIVHRIDRWTSGLIIAAKNDAAHAALSAQLADRSLSRVYEAIVWGRMREDAGLVDAPIGRCPTDRKRMAVTEISSRPAQTDWEVLARYREFTHIRCRLRTGRTHQIRVHMAHIGHPVLGDTVYAPKRPTRGQPGQCLHARELKFIHPATGEQMHLETPLPDYFTAALAGLGGEI
ncbi:MAG: RluA family pseudouridine synthase [Oscillospiraceae bacterium]|nr:RluA family pseudouridine synthase [Oscillospiraceae bacterium]